MLQLSRIEKMESCCSPNAFAPRWLIMMGIVSVTLGAVGGGAAAADRPPCQFPAIYNFGDSNSDTGGISAAFMPIPWPYGATFFRKAAGRDCDGRLLIDFIAEELDLPFLSAYLNSLGANFSHGANFATGGSTIRRQNETIFEYGISPFSLDVQLWHYDQFKSRSSDLHNQVTDPYHKSILPKPEDFSKALYTFDIGQNDLSVAFRKLSVEQQIAALPNIISQFSTAVQHLYEQGARLFWIHSTGPIGCLPVAVMYITDPKPGFLDQYGCIKGQNDMAIELNRQLKDAVIKLRTQLPEAAITYVDLYAAKYRLISTTKSQGFVDPLKICCGYHEKDGNVWCGQKGLTYNGTAVFGSSCAKPEEYVSWDGVHYSEAANKWFTDHILNGSLSDPSIPITHACYRN
ncbi:GDSL esterase/lipase-like protein [Drosera capensis]